MGGFFSSKVKHRVNVICLDSNTLSTDQEKKRFFFLKPPHLIDDLANICRDLAFPHKMLMNQRMTANYYVFICFWTHPRWHHTKSDHIPVTIWEMWTKGHHNAKWLYYLYNQLSPKPITGDKRDDRLSSPGSTENISIPRSWLPLAIPHFDIIRKV